MPELPEVQCFVNDLNEKFEGASIRSVILRRHGLRSEFDVAHFRRVFARGNRLIPCRRVGKRLVFGTDVGAFLVSLGMTGSFQPSKLRSPRAHEHITFCFEDGRVLGFLDPRRFGEWLPWTPGWGAGIVDGLDGTGLRRLFASREVRSSRRAVKVMLLDQKLIGGVGNIYALEALFSARIHPETPCAAVSVAAWNRLARALPQVFERAIAAGGSTISSYLRLGQAVGSFQSEHLVYGREGEPCSRPGCRGTIVRVVQAGRSTWFCPSCQNS